MTKILPNQQLGFDALVVEAETEAVVSRYGEARPI